MIDVHPPEHPAHSWSDFFIHMGTICLGLLIAIGLEQTVEWFHMRHRVEETREALARELIVNHKGYKANAEAFRYNTATMRNDLAVLMALRDHPKMKEGDLPGVITLGAMHMPTASSAWDAAKQTGIIEHFPINEVTQTELMYSALHSGDEMQSQYWNCINEASRYQMIDRDVTQLSREDLDKELSTIEECADINRKMGVELENLGAFRKDFVGGPTEAELQSVYVEAPASRAGDLAAAKAKSEAVLTPLRAKLSEKLDDAFAEFTAASKGSGGPTEAPAR